MYEQLPLFPDIKVKKGLLTGTEDKYNNYAHFVNKFKGKKTTDDCYTPPLVMDVINDYVRGLPNVGDRQFVRPFYPDGNYQTFNYPKNCIVVDNPPFSIYAKIIRWYLKNKIDFFLFGPTLTLTVRGADVCYIVTSEKITYENGAVVNTSFVTNLLKDVRFRTDCDLKYAIRHVNNKKSKQMKLRDYDEHVISASLLSKFSNSKCDIKTSQCQEIGDLDYLKRTNRSFFGEAYLVSDSCINDLKRGMESCSNIMSKDDEPESIPLSGRELEIIKKLNNQ